MVNVPLIQRESNPGLPHPWHLANVAAMNHRQLFGNAEDEEKEVGECHRSNQFGGDGQLYAQLRLPADVFTA